MAENIDAHPTLLFVTKQPIQLNPLAYNYTLAHHLNFSLKNLDKVLGLIHRDVNQIVYLSLVLDLTSKKTACEGKLTVAFT